MGQVRYALLPEIEVAGKRLGRHIFHDEQSHDFEAERAGKVVSVVHAGLGLPFDQGNVGKCTAEALCEARNSAPDHEPTDKVLDDKDSDELYSAETKAEGQPWPPNDPGGSGLMVCKSAKKLGWISSYRHAFGLQHALEALVQRPAMFGVPWYDSFDRPDANGVVSLPRGARIRGGHEICALRIVVEHELVGFAQSWGPQFGVPDPGMGLPNGGAFYVPFAVLDELLRQQGDCTVPLR